MKKKLATLNKTEVRLLDQLKTVAGAYGQCMPSNQQLMALLNLSEKQVQRTIQALQRNGFGWRDSSMCTWQGRETAVWRFQDSNAYLDWITAEKRKLLREQHWFVDSGPAHHDFYYGKTDDREKEATAAEIRQHIKHLPTLAELDITYPDNTF